MLILLNGMSQTATKELKQAFKAIKAQLPDNWIFIYIDTFHAKDKGVKVAKIDRNLQNISKGQAAPTPSQLANIKKIIL